MYRVYPHAATLTHVLSAAAVVLQWQSQMLVNRSDGPQSRKYLPSGPLDLESALIPGLYDGSSELSWPGCSEAAWLTGDLPGPRDMLSK